MTPGRGDFSLLHIHSTYLSISRQTEECACFLVSPGDFADAKTTAICPVVYFACVFSGCQDRIV